MAPNLLQRRFQANRPNETWVADITFIPTREGWLYLALLVDVCSRMIVGWSLSERITRQLVIEALVMALGRRRLPHRRCSITRTRAASMRAMSTRGCCISAASGPA